MKYIVLALFLMGCESKPSPVMCIENRLYYLNKPGNAWIAINDYKDQPVRCYEAIDSSSDAK